MADRIDKLHYVAARLDMNGSIFPIHPDECASGLWPRCEGKNKNETLYYRTIKVKKEHNPKMKMIMSMRGYNEEKEEYFCSYFSSMVSTEENRNNFIEQSIKFCRAFKFDGIDIIWNCPEGKEKKSNSNDMKNLALLMKELYEAFNKESKDTGKPRLINSFAIYPGLEQIENIEPESNEKDIWISYEDRRSLKDKIKYLRKKKLGGVAVWAMDDDDFRKCYPMMGFIYDELKYG
jgi:GH18 family chitinase